MGWRTVDRVRSEEELHALHVPGRRTVALVHITAADPLCTRGNTDLVARAIVTDGCTRGMAAMKKVIARERRIVAARIAGAVMNRVVPVEIVIGILPIPPTIVRLQRIMGPADTCVSAADNDTLASVTKRPDLWRMYVLHPRFNRSRTLWQRRAFNRALLRQLIVDNRIAVDADHIGPAC